MSKVKVEVYQNSDYMNVVVDGKTACSTPNAATTTTIRRMLEIVFEAMDVENVEVIEKK